jgi:hypothetical protein
VCTASRTPPDEARRTQRDDQAAAAAPRLKRTTLPPPSEDPPARPGPKPAPSRAPPGLRGPRDGVRRDWGWVLILRGPATPVCSRRCESRGLGNKPVCADPDSRRPRSCSPGLRLAADAAGRAAAGPVRRPAIGGLPALGIEGPDAARFL